MQGDTAPKHLHQTTQRMLSGVCPSSPHHRGAPGSPRSAARMRSSCLYPQPNSSGCGQIQGTGGAAGDCGSLPRGRLRRFRLPTDVLRSAGWSCPISMGVLVRKLSLNFCIRDSTVSCVTSGAATSAKGLQLKENQATMSPLPVQPLPSRPQHELELSPRAGALPSPSEVTHGDPIQHFPSLTKAAEIRKL